MFQMHMLMEVAAKLPEGSNARTKVTNTLITGLWDSLDHPPMGFQGPKYMYRMADGSNNVSFTAFFAPVWGSY